MCFHSPSPKFTWALGSHSVVGSIIIDMAKDSTLASAVGVVGVHWDTPEHASETTPLMTKLGKPYWRSENNVCDTAFPKWRNAFDWMVSILDNYVTGRATCTILCPIMHSWSMNWGRHLHGHSEAIEPWSGFFKLGAPFWAQAHITQTTRLGWVYLDGGGSKKILCSSITPTRDVARDSADTISGGSGGEVLIWTAIMSNDAADLTLVIVNQCGANTLDFELAGSLRHLAGARLLVRRTNETDWFAPQPSVSVGRDGTLSLSLAGEAIYSFTTTTTASRLAVTIPPRQPFPLPYTSNFETQGDQQQGPLLDAIYGVFEVNAVPQIYQVDPHYQQNVKALRQVGVCDVHVVPVRPTPF